MEPIISDERINNEGMIFCYRCKEYLSVDNFSPHYDPRVDRTYLRSWCHQCTNRDNRNRNSQNRYILSDTYIKGRLVKKGYKIEDITIQLIETQRSLLKLRRSLALRKTPLE